MPMEKSSAGLSKSCILIIVIASVERFAYKGVASNLVTYLTDVVNFSNSSAAKSLSSWVGFTSMLPLISAILADSYWDRYYTIVASSFLYVVGLVGLTLWALLYTWMPASSLFLPLYLISIGQGGYNPSLQAFGADQLQMDENLSCGKDEKTKFFQWWYFGICSGSLLGNSLMSYIQDNISWSLGFTIPTIAMVMSIIVFLCGTRFYVRKQMLTDNMNTEGGIIQAIRVAASKFFSQKNCSLPKDTEKMELELEGKPFRDDYEVPDISEQISANPQPGVASVILRLLPIWTMLLMFAVIFQQPATFFTKQGMTMKRNIGKSFEIPPAMLQSTITISIILLMPLYDKLIIPILRVLTRDDQGITVLQRIGIGMLLSIVAMVVAALVESKRLEIAREGGELATESQLSEMHLSVFWLLPQYILLGISDVFTVVGMQEFFYTEVPASMRTIGIALYLSVFGVGSFLGAILITIVEFVIKLKGHKCSWFSDNMKEARLDNYYWFLAVLSSVSFLMFVLLCKYYNGASAGNNSK
ncbi:Proton-dependent oligopeptide transporter family protein [Dioscorea alata]|uniref:Proton-dependent oligopeptide transporter family protein n=1 Tax=Dioscorea alata TaxID=55571 RepID=A0ACB7VK62_DIOAL|nr:Proton-dependent oligopeptide transporter family protein [Dioscorea alata]